MKLILASGSPRRLELLKMVGLSPLVFPALCEEHPELYGGDPARTVAGLSREKAEDAASRRDDLDDCLILAADTMVALGDELLGKPHTPERAFRMLKTLSGKTHHVYTGMTVIFRGKTVTHVEKSGVVFRELSDEEIRDYIATGEPLDKAGAYGIQGRGCLLVSGIEGDYHNVVGLPVSPLFALLREEFGLMLSDLKEPAEEI